MPVRIRRVLGVGVLLLVAGCYSGAGTAADLPRLKPLPMAHSSGERGSPADQTTQDVLIPVTHPPDALVVAREPSARWETRLDASIARLTPIAYAGLLGLAVAF